MIVIGAGLSGLIAANMLGSDVREVWERQSSLPNNHHAILRFRSSIVGDSVNIPFRQVRMIKAAHPWRNPVADALAYSVKVLGSATIRSITTANGEISERYIAPPDLIHQLGARVGSKLRFDRSWDGRRLGPMISTMPMPTLMKIMDYPEYEEVKHFFTYQQGAVIRGRLPNCDAYATLYIPNPEELFYRVSITGDELYIEYSESSRLGELSDHAFARRQVTQALFYLGLLTKPIYIDHVEFEVKQQTYAKINEVPREVRQRFIMWASTERNVYSLGRFATWRPGLLLDDIVNDVRVIRRLYKGDYTPIYQEKLR